MNIYPLLLLLLCYVPAFAISTPCTLLLNTPITKDSSLSQEELEIRALTKLQSEWIFSSQALERSIITESFDGTINDGNSTSIALKTRALFDALHKKEIAFLPPPFPKILMVMTNRADHLIPESEVKEFLDGLDLPIALEVRLPLWDLAEYKHLDPRELKGYLSEDYVQLMDRYDADFLWIVQRDSMRSLWDLRVINLQKEDLIRQRVFSLEEAKHALYTAILSKYSIQKSYSHQKLIMPRGTKETLVEEYQRLSKTAEILYPLLKYIDTDIVEYDLLTNWNSATIELFQDNRI